MTAEENREEAAQIQRLMVADLALWAGDAIQAEKTLRELVRPDFLRLPRLRPETIGDWAIRTAEARLRQLYYRRGRERRLLVDRKLGSTVADVRYQNKVVVDDSGLVRITCSVTSRERLVLRGYLTDVSPPTIDRVLRNAFAAQSKFGGREGKVRSEHRQASVAGFELRSQFGSALGQFRFSKYGTLGGYVLALPSLTEQQKAVTGLVQTASEMLGQK